VQAHALGTDSTSASWLPGRKATRVADYLTNADVTLEDQWPAYLDWLLDRHTRLRNALAAVGGVPDPVTSEVDTSR
jgi:hypothetical protein